VTAAEFLAAFPQTEVDHCTGGNCSAWRIKLRKGFEVLLTTADDDDGCTQPVLDTRRVCLSIYDPSGDRVDFEDETALRWYEVARIVRDYVERGVPE
jgi:hypothetical protein